MQTVTWSHVITQVQPMDETQASQAFSCQNQSMSEATVQV